MAVFYVYYNIKLNKQAYISPVNEVFLFHKYCGNCVALQQQAGSVGAAAKEIYFRDERGEQS